MFYVIGLGLGDAEDITVKGLNIIKRCDKVYLENYTSILSIGHQKLVNIIKRSIPLMLCINFLGRISRPADNTC